MFSLKFVKGSVQNKVTFRLKMGGERVGGGSIIKFGGSNFHIKNKI